MPDANLLKILRDFPGTAEGTCMICGASLSVYLPGDRPAARALLKVFDEHVAEKHGDDGAR